MITFFQKALVSEIIERVKANTHTQQQKAIDRFYVQNMNKPALRVN